MNFERVWIPRGLRQRKHARWLWKYCVKMLSILSISCKSKIVKETIDYNLCSSWFKINSKENQQILFFTYSQLLSLLLSSDRWVPVFSGNPPFIVRLRVKNLSFYIITGDRLVAKKLEKPDPDSVNIIQYISLLELDFKRKIYWHQAS